MQQIKFDNGQVTFNVNDIAQITFNPTDEVFIERLYRAFEALETRQEQYKTDMNAMENANEIFDYCRTMDKQMRETIDDVFQTPICEQIFPGVSVYSLANGLPIWLNFILAVIDIIEEKTKGESKRGKERLKKYTSKYHR